MNQNHENTKYFTTYTFFWIQVFIKGIDEFHPIMEKNVFHNLFVWFSLIYSPFFNKILVFHELVSFLKRNFNSFFVCRHVWKHNINWMLLLLLSRGRAKFKMMKEQKIDFFGSAWLCVIELYTILMLRICTFSRHRPIPRDMARKSAILNEKMAFLGVNLATFWNLQLR